MDTKDEQTNRAMMWLKASEVAETGATYSPTDEFSDMDLSSPITGADSVEWIRRMVVSQHRMAQEMVTLQQQMQVMLGLLNPSQEFPAGVSADEIAVNLAARDNFVASFKLGTGQDVANYVKSTAKNRGAIASRWRREQKIFAVSWKQKLYYPLFQIGDDGHPLAVIKEILGRLAPGRTDWQIALWFSSPNGWLDGKRPVDVLNEPTAVVRAAEMEVGDLGT